MAFDVYAGTFVRFYTRQWENVGKRYARLNGLKYEMIYINGDEGPPSAEQVEESVHIWREEINSVLAKSQLGPIEWSEEDSQPYFTDRPGWEGYSALQLWAAYAERPDVMPPHALPESWDDDKTWQDVTADEERIHFRTIIQASVWLPGDFEFCFKFRGLVEDQVIIGSTGGFVNQLRELEENPLRWKRESLFSKLGRKKNVPFKKAAEWGHESFLTIAEQAHDARLPIMLSF